MPRSTASRDTAGADRAGTADEERLHDDPFLPFGVVLEDVADAGDVPVDPS